MRVVIIITVATFALAGCASNVRDSSETYPGDYKADALAARPTLFKDPSSVRDAAIGTPTPNWLGWKACFRANAKNSFGGYVGLQMFTLQFYRNGSPPILLPVTIYDGCQPNLLDPFPEMNGDYVKPITPEAPAKPKATTKSGARA